MFLLVALAGMFSLDSIMTILGDEGGDDPMKGTIIGIALLFLMWGIIALMAKWDNIFGKKDDKPNEEQVITEAEN